MLLGSISCLAEIVPPAFETVFPLLHGFGGLSEMLVVLVIVLAAHHNHQILRKGSDELRMLQAGIFQPVRKRPFLCGHRIPSRIGSNGSVDSCFGQESDKSVHKLCPSRVSVEIVLLVPAVGELQNVVKQVFDRRVAPLGLVDWFPPTSEHVALLVVPAFRI